MSDTKKSSLSVEVFRDGKFVEVDPKTVLRNDHNALEALIEDYQDFVIRFGSKLDENDGLRLISAARQDRERLVGALEKIEYAALKFPHPSECDHLHEVANIAKAALDPERKR